jgi:hypothetical protein
MSTENLRLRDMIGWQDPGLSESQTGEEPGLPNPYRVFKAGWGGLRAATFVPETFATYLHWTRCRHWPTRKIWSEFQFMREIHWAPFSGLLSKSGMLAESFRSIGNPAQAAGVHFSLSKNVNTQL